ncbi:hypothetical protein LC612_38385 [Nostoc sp. CHAB 5834]|nr:hypothetical protein [Nostoc sp. CHAB 5834]
MLCDKKEVEVSRHAAFRVVERSGLGPRSIQEMLEKEQYFWAIKPLEGHRRYALIFDSCTGGYVVAILAPAKLEVITVLTQDQFETWRGSPLSPMRMHLARIALMKGELQDVEEPKPVPSPPRKQTPSVPPPTPKKEPDQAFDDKGPLWRFDIELEGGRMRELGTFDLRFVRDSFLFVLAPSKAASFRRRARRVAQTWHFGNWFLTAIPSNVDPGTVVAVKASAMHMVGQKVLWTVDVTEDLKIALFSKRANKRQSHIRHSACMAHKAMVRKLNGDVTTPLPADSTCRLAA